MNKTYVYVQMVKKFLTLGGIRGFISLFIDACHWAQYVSSTQLKIHTLLKVYASVIKDLRPGTHYPHVT
jgi:hypothetical protein